MDEEPKKNSSQYPLNNSDLARNILLLAKDDGVQRTDLLQILGEELRVGWGIKNGDSLDAARRTVIANLEVHFLTLVHPVSTNRAKFLQVVRVMFNMYDDSPLEKRSEYDRRRLLTNPAGGRGVATKTIWNHVNRACNQIEQAIIKKTHKIVVIDEPDVEQRTPQRAVPRTGLIVSDAEEASFIPTQHVRGISGPVPENPPPLKPRPLPHRITTDPQVQQAAHELATEIQRRANKERNLRQVHDPFPLPVRWTQGPRHLSDWWENIRSTANDTDAIPLAGNLDQVLDFFDAIPSHRLVVLGRAGAGKTILTLEFVLNFLASEQHCATSLVPVIFSMASWNPTEQSVDDWMAEQLIAEYPFLRQRAKSKRTMAAELVRQRLVFPVMDGFDEMAPGLQPYALRALNSSRNDGDPLVLTSRPVEYADAVDSSDVLTHAAVIQLEDLTLDDLLSYLPNSTKPTKEAETENKWGPVLDRLRDTQDDAAAVTLLSVLLTPLMVSLARTIYSDTPAGPIDLLDTDQFPDATALSNHLLDGLIPAVYDQPPQDAEPDGKKPLQWDPDKARRWLELLALRAHILGERNITWWNMAGPAYDKVTLWILGAASIISGVSVLFLGRDVGYLDAMVCGLFMGFSSRFIINIFDHSPPSAADDAAIGLSSARLYIGVALYGAMWRLGTVWEWVGLAALVSYFLLFMTALRILSPSMDLSKNTDPDSVLRTTRKNAVVKGMLAGVVVIGPILLCWLFFGHPEVANLVVLTVIFGCVLGHVFGSLWGAGLQTRVWRALTGRGPWRLMAFLDDAHRRGVLRRTGALYQFRHALLQNWLAADALDQLPMHIRERKGILVARANLAGAWIESGNLDAADAEFRGILEVLDRTRVNIGIHVVFGILHNLIWIAWQRGEVDSVMVCLRKLLELKRQILGDTRGSTLDTWCLLARVLIASGHVEDASKELRELLDSTSGVVPEENIYMIEAKQLLSTIEQNSNSVESVD